MLIFRGIFVFICLCLSLYPHRIPLLTGSNKTIYNVRHEDHIGHPGHALPRVQGKNRDKRRENAKRRDLVHRCLQCRRVAAVRLAGTPGAGESADASATSRMGGNGRAFHQEVSRRPA